MGNEKKWKALAYVIAGARVCTEKQPHLTLTTDEAPGIEGRSIIFGNGRKYGGPLNFFAEADNSDGASGRSSIQAFHYFHHRGIPDGRSPRGLSFPEERQF